VRRGTRATCCGGEPPEGIRRSRGEGPSDQGRFRWGFWARLLQTVYAGVRKVTMVLDNLNTHFRASFEEIWADGRGGIAGAGWNFYYTPSTPVGSTWRNWKWDPETSVPGTALGNAEL